MRATLAVLATLALAVPAAAQEKPTNWVVTATFKPDGTSTCIAKFPAPRGSQTLTLEARTPKGKDALVAAFIVGGIPPLLDGRKGVMRSVAVTIGSRWVARDLKADWSKGDEEANSKITVVAAPKIGDVIQPLADGGTLTVEVPLSNGTYRYSFDLTGSKGPMTAFVDCVRRWSGGEK